MDVKEAILHRKSIRKYLGREVSKETIQELIDAARLAPSANNIQPSRYLIVSDADTKMLLRQEKIFVQDFICTVPVIIVCCTDPVLYKKRSDADISAESKAVLDLSLASSYLMLRATELGLGTCYIGLMEKEKIKTVLNIPAHMIVPFVITVGYAAEDPPKTPRKNIEEILL